MGSLAKDARPIVGMKAGGKCGVAKLLDDLDDEDTAAVTGWIDDHNGIPAKALARRLKEHDLQLSDGVIQRHRRGDCACDG